MLLLHCCVIDYILFHFTVLPFFLKKKIAPAIAATGKTESNAIYNFFTFINFQSLIIFKHYLNRRTLINYAFKRYFSIVICSSVFYDCKTKPGTANKL